MKRILAIIFTSILVIQITSALGSLATNYADVVKYPDGRMPKSPMSSSIGGKAGSTRDSSARASPISLRSEADLSSSCGVLQPQLKTALLKPAGFDGLSGCQQSVEATHPEICVGTNNPEYMGQIIASQPDTTVLPSILEEPKPQVLNTTNVEPMGTTTSVFTETFEGIFPGDNWWTGDTNALCDLDYWKDTSYRSHSGSWSGWCAQVGNNSVYGGTNAQQHKYDNYMDAYMSKKYVVDMSTWKVGYVDFWARWDTETNYDYLIAQWYGSDSAWHDDVNYKLTGTSSGQWSHYFWRVPDNYLISSGAFGFKFHSDVSNVNEGVYLDDINLYKADVTLDNYYISPTSVHPGETFTAYYYISNPCPFFTLNVGLGLSIMSPSGTVYNDPAHDTVVSISQGAYWVSRLFTVPASAPLGTYSVAWGLWSGSPGSSRSWGGPGWVSNVLIVQGWPDLMWTDIWTSPSPPTGGQSASIISQIKNQGSSDATATFRNYFYIDTVYQGYGDNSGLVAGGTSNWGLTTTLGPGYHDLRAVADVNNNVAESNEANNDYTKRIWWKGPDLIVVDIWWIDAYGNRDPAITSGQPFTVYFQIKNNGDADAVGTFTSYVFIDGWGNAAGSNNGLAAGATYTWYTENVFISSPAGHSIRAVVDYNGAIAEANQNTGSGTGTGETNNERVETVTVQKSRWTALVYLDGDNNLEQYEIDDFNEMAQAGSTASVSVAVQMDRIGGYDTRYGDWQDCKRFYMKRGTTPNPSEAVQSLGEVNMGDPSVLSGFAVWGIDRYQADHYLIVLDDHGGSWVGCCWDDTSGDHLSISDMNSAFSTIASHLGRHIEVAWFDDCLTSSTEIAYQMRNYVDYMTGSETVGWTSTWNYNTVITNINNNPAITSQSLAISLVDWGTPVDDATHQTQSISAIDLSRIPNLVTVANNIAQQMKDHMHGWQLQIRNARSATSWFEGPYSGDTQRFVDLKQLCSNLKAYLSDSTVKSLAQSIMDQIGPLGGGVGYVVMRERHSASVSFCNGLSIYFPDAYGKYDFSYPTGNDFASNTQWDEFLSEYYNPSNASPAVTVTSPAANVAWSGTRTITWTGADSNYDNVAYDIYVSTDGGSTWRQVTSLVFQENPTPTTHSYQLDTRLYADSTQCIIRINYNDGYGGIGSVASNNFTIDNTPPTTGIVHYAGDSIFSLIAQDRTSGVQTIYYRIDGGAWNPYSSPVPLALGDTHTVEGYSRDNAGNDGPVVHLIVYYLTMSTNYGSVNPNSGWYDSGSIVSISATAPSGYVWNGWSGSGSGSYTGMSNPVAITIGGPISETASWNPPPPPGSIAGYVTDSVTGAGIPAATVSYSGPSSGSATTDSNGYYIIDNLTPGPYSITASKSNYASQTTTATVSSSSTTTVNFQLQPNPGSIVGRVTDTVSGSGIGGASISVSGPSSGSAITDSNGYYTVANLAPGDSYSVTASKSGYASQTKYAMVSSGGTTTVDFQLQPNPGSVGGRVTDAVSGNGVSGATVSCSGPSSGSTTTDSNGYYALSNLTPGQYQVSASKNGFQTQTKTATVTSDSVTTVDFQLQPNPGFADGFESGDFSNWTGTRMSTGETASVTNTLSHHGVYSARFTSNGNGGSETAYCYENISSSTELYARGYFYVSQSGIVSEDNRFHFIVFMGGNNPLAYAGWRLNGSIVKWTIIIRDANNSPWPTAYSAVSPSLNRWYCVELHWKKDTLNGLGELWVDGSLVCTITSKNTALQGNVDTVRFGLGDMVNCTNTVIYGDCAKMATTYVGPEPSATVFEDGFESGNFGSWSGSSVTTGETATVVNALSHHGTYSAMFTSNGNGGTERAYCYKTLSAITELYMRAYFYVSASGIVANDNRFYFIVFRAGGNPVAFAGWRMTGGVVKWNLLIRHGTGWATNYSAISPSLNQWYCVELHWKEDSAAGLGELWVNGALACSASRKNTAYYGDVNRIDFGLAEIVNCGATIIYGDCAKMATTYVGPEPSATVFEDGFESGNFGSWSGSSVTTGETAAVVNTIAKQGTYSGMFTSNGNSGTERAYCYKTIGSLAELYASGYFYVSASGIVANDNRFYFIVFRAGGNPVAFAGWRMTGGVVKWNLLIRHGTGWATNYSTTSPVLNQWYSLELHWKEDATNGVAELWVNGALVCSTSGKNTSYYGDVNRVEFGLPELVNCAPTTVYGDSCVVSKARIAPTLANTSANVAITSETKRIRRP